VRLVLEASPSIVLTNAIEFSTHTTVLFAIILTFVFTVYATSDLIGSPGRMHDLLTAAAAANPVPGNAHGSYITVNIFMC
jgi:Na+/proline symporter